MKSVIRVSAILLVTLTTGVPSLALSQQEAVNGYYDSKNDWIVFEWLNPQTGKQEVIYDSANKIKPMLHAEVSFDSSGVGTYAYQVTNLKGSVQLLDDISVKHYATVSGATSPVPQSEWYSTEYQGKGAWSWSKIGGSVRGISAGQTVSGFSFGSKSLPTIVDAWFAGKRRAQFRFPSPDDDTEEVQSSFGRVFDGLKAKYPNKFVDTVQQKTVGPIDPPATFAAPDFIQNLLSLEGQSLSLGWIANQGIARSLQVKLDHAKKAVLNCKIKTAKNEIDAFIHEVREAGERDDRGEHKERAGKDERRERHEKLSPEAYALMYYNGKYLLTQLENKTNLNCPAGRDHDDDDRDADDGRKKDR